MKDMGVTQSIWLSGCLIKGQFSAKNTKNAFLVLKMPIDPSFSSEILGGKNYIFRIRQIPNSKYQNFIIFLQFLPFNVLFLGVNSKLKSDIIYERIWHLPTIR